MPVLTAQSLTKIYSSKEITPTRALSGLSWKWEREFVGVMGPSEARRPCSTYLPPSIRRHQEASR